MVLLLSKFCGAEEIRNYLEERLAIFDIQLSRVDVYFVSFTDMGADGQRLAEMTGIFMFPCLAHVINLIAKK